MRFDVVGIVLVAAFAVTVVWLLAQRGKGRRPPV
jgi:hypothetical protein